MRRFAIVIVVLAGSLAWGSGTELPPGPAKSKIEASCQQCHAVKVILKQHQDAKWWAKTMDRMVTHGLEMEPADQAVVLKYLTVNFGVTKSGGSKKAAKH